MPKNEANCMGLATRGKQLRSLNFFVPSCNSIQPHLTRYSLQFPPQFLQPGDLGDFQICRSYNFHYRGWGLRYLSPIGPTQRVKFGNSSTHETPLSTQVFG